MKQWPEWWDWEIEITPHLLKRMHDREFTELDLRAMLERALRFRRAETNDRWVIETKYRRHPWEVVVEPDFDGRTLVIVTAYPVW